MMVAITIVVAFMFMLGTASFNRLFILSLRDAASGFLKRGNPLVNSLQHALLMLLELLSLIARLPSLRLLLVGRKSDRQKRKRENGAK
jgi:hypothetical protein